MPPDAFRDAERAHRGDAERAVASRWPTARARRLPTQLSGVRVALAPVVMALVLLDPPGWGRPAAAAVFAVSAATDWIDGRLARRWAVTSTLGAFLDTTADKLLVTGALIALVAVDRASPWAAAIIIGRELLLMGLRGVVATTGVVVAPSIWGKLKTTVQFVALLAAILRPPVPVGPVWLDEVLLWAAAAVTLASAVDYLVKFRVALASSGGGR